MKSRYSFGYSFTFAIINFSEALIQLICLGLWSPTWVIPYASWYARRHFYKLAKELAKEQGKGK